MSASKFNSERNMRRVNPPEQWWYVSPVNYIPTPVLVTGVGSGCLRVRKVVGDVCVERLERRTSRLGEYCPDKLSAIRWAEEQLLRRRARARVEHRDCDDRLAALDRMRADA